MRSIWQRGVIATAAVILAVCMLAINIGFELAGSVPDVEGCGFLAGNLLALLFLYPAAAALVAARATGFIAARSSADDEALLRCGGRIGGWGGGIYLALGLVGMLNAPHSSGSLYAASAAWALVIGYLVSAMLGDRLGALFKIQKRRQTPVRPARTQGVSGS